MTWQHTRLCSQYNIMYKRSKIRGLWHTFGCSTDDERCVHARARWVRVRTPKTHPGLDTRVPGCDVWAASSSGHESRRRTGGEVPKNLVNESRREKWDKERDIHVRIYLEQRKARGAIDEATNKVRVPFDRKRESDREGKWEKGTLDATGRDPCSTRRNHERCNNHMRNTHNQEECGSGNCIRAVVRVRLYKQKPLVCFWSGFNFLMK